MSFTGKARAVLRAEAHHLKPLVHIGHHGITPPVTQTVDDALRTHELVKIQTGKTSDVTAKQAVEQLAAQLNAEVIQVIGRTATLYRHNPAIVRRAGDVPPWKR
ncbi:MAG TPA: YhbY family RNA-binding protein [Gemmatimonadaceae bacterium]|nr:YhbY family RNA-binding protein [Gemmatimonadaceae bacterium]